MLYIRVNGDSLLRDCIISPRLLKLRAPLTRTAPAAPRPPPLIATGVRQNGCVFSIRGLAPYEYDPCRIPLYDRVVGNLAGYYRVRRNDHTGPDPSPIQNAYAGPDPNIWTHDDAFGLG